MFFPVHLIVPVVNEQLTTMSLSSKTQELLTDVGPVLETQTNARAHAQLSSPFRTGFCISHLTSL